jgi:3-polyprenyl-4-hydroxybenzoate decarboxylase
MTTIFDRIHLHLKLARQLECNAILLGRLEQEAYRESLKLLYQIEATLEAVNTGTMTYRGMRIIPCAVPSMFALVKITYEDKDPSVKEQAE